MNYAKYIDHTLLKSDASEESIKKLCEEAKEYHFASVCVNPTHVKFCANNLKGSDVLVCTVIGFPLGATSYLTKGFETAQAIKDGASEIDMVINVGALKDKNDDLVLKDIQEVVKNAKNHTVKVIIETCYLTDEEKVRACLLAKKAGAKFVKTSTGFGSGGATVNDVKLMKQTVGNDLEVKASGGIRTFEDMVAMINAGATRIGTSSGPKLVNKQDSTTAY